MRLLRDSRGKASWTLTMVLPVAVMLTVRFLLGGVTVKGGTWTVMLSALTGYEYAAAVGVWLGLFGYRETVEKRPVEKRASGPGPGLA